MASESSKIRSVFNTTNPQFVKLDYDDYTIIYEWYKFYHDRVEMTENEVVTIRRIEKIMELMENKIG